MGLAEWIIVLTLVQASGCSLRVVRTSCAIFCCSPDAVYIVSTTWSSSPISNFWLKSKRRFTVSWARAVMLSRMGVWIGRKISYFPIFRGTRSCEDRFLQLQCCDAVATGVNWITPVYGPARQRTRKKTEVNKETKASKTIFDHQKRSKL